MFTLVMALSQALVNHPSLRSARNGTMSQCSVGMGSCPYWLEEATTYVSHLQKGPHFFHFQIF